MDDAQANELRPLLTRNDLWQMFSGYSFAVIALVFWPDKASWTRGAVVAIALGAFLAGWLAWILIGERRLPRLWFRSGPRQPSVPGALVIAFLVFLLAFMFREGIRQAWPDEYVILPEPPRDAGASGTVVWDFATIEVPVNTARQFIAYFAFLFGGLALGSGLLQGFHAWRARHGRGPRSRYDSDAARWRDT